MKAMSRKKYFFLISIVVLFAWIVFVLVVTISNQFKKHKDTGMTLGQVIVSELNSLLWF